MTRSMLLVANVTAAGLLAVAFVGGFPWLAALWLVLFCGWIYAFVRRWDAAANLLLFTVFGFAAAGFRLDLEPGLLYPAAFLSLAGWDLAGLHAKLSRVEPDGETTALQTRHLLRLALVLVIGGGLVWLALSLRVTLSFEWVAVLAVLAAWGLARLISRLFKKE